MITATSDIEKNYKDYAFILRNLQRKAANYVYAKMAKLKLVSIKSTQIGQKAPELIGATNKGKSFASTFSASKYTLIEFWASWCGPCRMKNPAFIKIYDRYHKNGFDMISVSLDDNKENWLAAIKADKLPWQQVSELKDQPESINAANFNVTAIPYNYLVDNKGIIVRKNIRLIVFFSFLKVYKTIF